MIDTYVVITISMNNLFITNLKKKCTQNINFKANFLTF